MTKPPFFKHPVGLTVGEIAALTGAELRNGACLDHVITNIAPLDRAGPSDLAFLDTAKYAAALTSTQAGACLMTERFESQAPSGLNVLRAQEPYRAFVDVARKLYPNALRKARCCCGSSSSAYSAHWLRPSAAICRPGSKLACWACSLGLPPVLALWVERSDTRRNRPSLGADRERSEHRSRCGDRTTSCNRSRNRDRLPHTPVIL
jgi:hypothetical protein